MNPTSFGDIFDFSDGQSVQKAIELINGLIKSIEGLTRIAQRAGQETRAEMESSAAAAIALQKAINSLSGDNLASAGKQAQKMADGMDELIKQQQRLKETEAELAKKSEELKKVREKLTEAQEGEANSIENLTKKLKTLTAEYSKLNTEEAGNADKKEELLSKIGLTTQRLEQQKKALSDTRKESAAFGKTTGAAVESLDNMRVNLARLTAQRNKLSIESKEFDTAQKRIKALNDRIKNFESQGGDFRRNVGNYASAFQGLSGAMGGGLGAAAGLLAAPTIMGAAGVAAQLLIGPMKRLFETFMDFEKESAKLAGVLGKTRSEITLLNNDAKRLGATTAFTTGQVTQLQTEFAKLGFTEREILNATEATLNLSTATGSSLADAAAVAGTTIRGFGLDAKDTARVTDIMGKSFSTSALDIVKFRESMKFVAPIARSANIPIEQTTAMLGALADAGISGSQAGTALRRIFSDMAKTGKPAAEALRDLAAKGLTVADAADEVGRNAQTALLVLANNTRKIEELNEAYQNADGTLKKMADEQLNTLSGQFTILNSAVDGFLLSIEDGTGIFSTFSRHVLNDVTSLFNELTRLNSFQIEWGGLSRASEEIKRAKLETDRFARSGKEVAVVLKDAFGSIDDQEFLRKADEMREKFVKIFQDEGASAKDAGILFETYAKMRRKAFEESIGDSIVVSVRNAAEKMGVDQLRLAIDSLTQSYRKQKEAGEDVDNLNKQLQVLENALTERLKEQSEEAKKAAEAYKKLQAERKKAFDTKLSGIDEFYERLKLERQLIDNNRNLSRTEDELAQIEIDRHKARMEAIVEYEGYSNRALKEQLALQKLIGQQQEKDIKALQEALKGPKEIEIEMPEPDDELEREEEEKNRKLLLLQQQYEREKLKIQIRAKKTGLDLSDEEIAAERKMLEEKLRILEEFEGYSNAVLQAQLDLLSQEPDMSAQVEAVDRLYNYIESRVQAAHEMKMRALDREIENQKDLLNAEIKIAEATGQRVDLAERERKIAEKEKEQRDLQKQAIRQQEYISFLKSYQSYLAAEPGSPGKALVSALKDIGFAKTVAGAFREGVIDFKGKGTETSDSNVVLISNRESVVKAKATAASKKVLTDINEMRFDDVQYKKLLAIGSLDMPKTYTLNVQQIARQQKEGPPSTSNEWAAVLGKLDSIDKHIRQLESSHSAVDSLLNVVEHVRQGQNTKKNIYVTGKTMPFV